MADTHECKSDAQFTEAISSSTPTFVDFYATWCPPCRMISPVVDRLAKEYEGKCKFIKVNVDDLAKTAEAQKVEAMPTFILFQNGKPVGSPVVGADEASIRALLKKNLDASPTAPAASSPTSPAAGEVHECQNDGEFTTAVKSSTPTFVDFYAQWCPPCKRISPVVDQIAKEYAGKCNFIKVDVDKLEATAKEQNIEAMPTFMIFKDGKRVDEPVRGASEPAIRALLKKCVA